MASTSGTTIIRQQVKLPRFTGKQGDNLDTFLAQIKLRFKDAGANTDEEKVRLVLSCLRDEAATWMTNYIEKYTDTTFIKTRDAHGSEVGVWRDYKAFVTYLLQSHGRHDDPKEKARNEFIVIQQGRASVLQYNQEFDRLIAMIGDEYSNENLRVLIYRRGLDRRIRNTLAVIPESKSWNLVTWQDNAVRLAANRQLQYLPREHKPMVGRDHRPSYHETEYYGEPMDIDDFGRRFRKRKGKLNRFRKFKPKKQTHWKEQATESQSKETDQSKRFTRKKGNKTNFHKSNSNKKDGKQCYRCGKLGHWKRDCRTKLDQKEQQVEIEVAMQELQQDDCNQHFHVRGIISPMVSQEEESQC